MTAGREGSVAPFVEVKMEFVAGNRKAFLKERLIPTPLKTQQKKKSRKSGSQGKTGRKIRPIRR
jgi:hypothetical protein